MPILLLVWHPSECWAILGLACRHRYVCVCNQEIALPEDWVGFMNQWPHSSPNDFTVGDASFPPCHCDVPSDLGISGREEYFSNLLGVSHEICLFEISNAQ